MRIRSIIVTAVVGAVLVACTAGEDPAGTEGTVDGTAAPGTSVAATGPAPGVTDDTIKVGVEYVDLAALGEIASLDHGDYELSYEILFDAINADGGINGRMIEPYIEGVNPVGSDAAEAACVTLTQDVEVFAVLGFFQGDDVLCPLETHATAVIGGQMTPERLERAAAPWFTTESGTDLQSDIVRAMAEAGELDGTLGVYGLSDQEAQINDLLLPLLDEEGIAVAEVGIVDAGTEDVTATNAATQVVVERFEASGVDQVLVVGTSALGWANGVEPTDYRPQLLLTDPGAIQAYVADEAGRDLSLLDDAVAGNQYGPAQNIWELPQMQECIAVLEEGGVPVPEPDSLPEGSGSVYIAGTTACYNVELFRVLVEAAGEDLNYGTLAAAADGLEVQLPNQPDPVTYGPPPSADGDAPAFLYDWDPASETFALRE